jgi:hypothetical protein
MINMANIMDQNQAPNAAANVAAAKLAETKRAAGRKEKIEAYDYALNLLSSVNSQEDMVLAKKILQAKYPDTSDGIEAMLPKYDPQAVKLIRRSLRTETQKLKLEQQENELKGFGPGTQIYKGGQKMEQVPFAPQKDNFEVFANADGDEIYVKEGGKIPKGYNKVRGTGTTVNVNTGNTGLTKASTTAVQKDVMEGIKNVESFQETRKLFKPEYLTLFGKGEKMTAQVADKLGISTEEQKKLIRDRSAWFRQAKADFIAYRKWATGVAGGEKELKEIATSFPDPVKNSPTEYQANLDNIEETTERVLRLNKDFLKVGTKAREEAAKGDGEPVPVKKKILKYDKQGNRIVEE